MPEYCSFLVRSCIASYLYTRPGCFHLSVCLPRRGNLLCHYYLQWLEQCDLQKFGEILLWVLQELEQRSNMTFYICLACRSVYCVLLEYFNCRLSRVSVMVWMKLSKTTKHTATSERRWTSYRKT